MRAVVDGVGPGERTDAVGELDDPPDVGRGADRVGGDREGDDARPVAELRGEAVVVEREVVVHVDLAHDDAEVLLQREPRRDVAVVVELRHEHLVARLQLAGERPGEQEVERGHALAERHLVAGAAEERAGLLVGEIDERRRAARGLVRGADVRVVVAEVAGDRVDHLVGALRPAGAVEEREPALQGGEAGTNGGDVEQRGTHDEVLSVDGPVIVGLHGQRGADEAVALALRDERARARRRGGAGSSVTSRSTRISTNAKRPSSSRRVTTPCAAALATGSWPARRAW